MEQGRLIALSPIRVLDHERAVGNEVRNPFPSNLGGVDRPSMGARGPDRGEMALAAAPRPYQAQDRIGPIRPALDEAVGARVRGAHQEILPPVAWVERQ